jgi:hypothetical protein
MRFPRTRKGWRMLFWIALRRCYRCHGPTMMDPWAGFGGDNHYRWCLPCGGSWQPRGVLHGLIENARAEAKPAPAPSGERAGEER